MLMSGNKMIAYKKFMIAAAALTAGIIYYTLQWRESRETAVMPKDILSGNYTVNMSGTAQRAEQLPDWWLDRLKAAYDEGKWRVAADYARRIAGYYRSLGQTKEAEAWYAESENLWTMDPGTDRRFYDQTPPPPEEVTISLYVSAPAETNRKLEKFEPVSGAYLGMFGFFDWPQVEQTFGKYHPIGLTYAGWRRDENDKRNYFPTRLVESIKAAGGGALQIGWEPQYGLAAVRDDDYVRLFARQARESGMPIFLRFASEMNGNWVPWYDDPATYVEKFRLIANIMKEEAPNVAMVWSPNYVPADNIDAYYPGDEYVDWVGVSLYSTPITAGEEDFSKNQIDYLRPIYEKYSHKPIMISEGAVSYTYRKTNANYEKWAEGQIGNMYGFLPRMFPQVKAITYFNISKSRAESNNFDFLYDLRENPLMYDKYRRLIQSDYFLTKVEQGARTKENIRYEPIGAVSDLKGKRKLFAYVKMPMDIQPHSVAYFQKGKRIGISYQVPWEIEADFSLLDPDEPITVVVYNDKRETMAQQSIRWANANR
jgi:hypothetical protein